MAVVTASAVKQSAHGQVAARGNGRAFAAAAQLFQAALFFGRTAGRLRRSAKALCRRPGRAAKGLARAARGAAQRPGHIARGVFAKGALRAAGHTAQGCAHGLHRLAHVPLYFTAQLVVIVFWFLLRHNSASPPPCICLIACCCPPGGLTARRGGIFLQWQGPRARRPPRRT